MFGTAHKGANAYAAVDMETGVLAASPHKLIVMLFDGAKLAIDRAYLHIQNHEIAAKGRAISHAMTIINDGLRASLNKEVGGEVALNLDALYEYMCNRLIEANLKNDLAILSEISGLIIELRDAWMMIEKTTPALPMAAQANNRKIDPLTPRAPSFARA
jgi:flagellar secretion chaperone FliS